MKKHHSVKYFKIIHAFSNKTRYAGNKTNSCSVMRKIIYETTQKIEVFILILDSNLMILM
jgi:hypothetical protein